MNKKLQQARTIDIDQYMAIINGIDTINKLIEYISTDIINMKDDEVRTSNLIKEFNAKCYDAKYDDFGESMMVYLNDCYTTYFILADADESYNNLENQIISGYGENITVHSIDEVLDDINIKIQNLENMKDEFIKAIV